MRSLHYVLKSGIRHLEYTLNCSLHALKICERTRRSLPDSRKPNLGAYATNRMYIYIYT